MTQFLFIFESIGTSELMLIGIVALIFLGPRRLPEIARKIGKITSEFRGTANEFKETWRREVDFEQEAKALDINNLDEDIELDKPVKRESVAMPTVRSIDSSEMERSIETIHEDVPHDHNNETATSTKSVDNDSGKESWL